MRRLISILTLSATLTGVGVVRAQSLQRMDAESCESMASVKERSTEFRLYFRVGKAAIDSTYMTNNANLRDITTTLSDIRKDSAAHIMKLSFCGAASPEGSYQINRKLARKRLAALETFVRRQINLPDSVICRDDSYIPWDYLKAQVEKSNLPNKKEIVSIIEEEPRLVKYNYTGARVDNRIVRLKRLNGGRTWTQMYKRFFSPMRSAYAVIVTYKKTRPVQESENTSDTIAKAMVAKAAETAPDTVTADVPSTTDFDELARRIHLKTNAIAWGGEFPTSPSRLTSQNIGH